MLNGARFPVGTLHLRLFSLLEHTGGSAANLARLFRTLARIFRTNRARLQQWPSALAGVIAAPGTWLRLQRLAVPLRIVEMKIRSYEIVNGEIVLAVIKPRPSADDLLELNHGVDGAHENDVANVAGIHAGREFLRRGQNRRDGLLVVLKVP